MRFKELKLDEHSLTYSHVELSGNGMYSDFYVEGIPDEYTIGDTCGYNDFVEDMDEQVDITVTVDSFNVGRGESVSPDETQLECLVKNMDAIEKEYGIDHIQAQHFTCCYEPDMWE